MPFLLDIEDPAALQAHLHARGLLFSQEEIQSLEIPGAGNMNYTLRVVTNQRSLIVKQARPYVEKYPQIPAPAERAEVEAAYYQRIEDDAVLSGFSPKLLGSDPENHLLLLEDLGKEGDFTFLYQKGKTLSSGEAGVLISYLSALHRNHRDDSGSSPLPNAKMRALNAEHIFRFPLMEDNGFDLDTVTEGLQEVAMDYKRDESLKLKIEGLSRHYLDDGAVLLHGDFFPGSWLRVGDGLRVIDPEFCFYGVAEFDLSVLRAHLIMSGQSPELIASAQEQYRPGGPFNPVLITKLCGVEIIRRLIGLAQLPLDLNLREKTELLEEAHEMVMR